MKLSWCSAAALLLSMLVLLLAASCGNSGSEHGITDNSQMIGNMESLPQLQPVSLDHRKLKVVATTSIIGDVVQNIGGDSIDLKVIMASGTNPHSYEATPQDIKAMEDADVVLINGLNLEEALLSNLNSIKNVPIVAVSAGIAVITDDDHDHESAEAGHPDGDEPTHDHVAGNPHVWFSPKNVIIWSDNIGKILSMLDPANSRVYKSNSDIYRGKLVGLDSRLQSEFNSIPVEKRKLISDHVDLDYLARDYGLDIVSTVIPSMSDGAEPSPRDLARMVDDIRTNNVRVLCVGATAGSSLQSLVASIAGEIGSQLKVVTILTGSLAAAGTPGDTYLSYMDQDAGRLVDALR